MSAIIMFTRNGTALRHIVGAVGLAGMLLLGRVVAAPPAATQQSDKDGDGEGIPDFDGMFDGCDTDDTTPETDPDVGMVCRS